MCFKYVALFLSTLSWPSFSSVRYIKNENAFNHVVVEKMGSKESMTLGEALYDGPIFLIVWASYCNPCVAKIPSIPLLQDALKSSGLKTKVVMVSIDPRKDEAGHLCGKAGSALQLWSENLSRAMKKTGVRCIPCAFFLFKKENCVKVDKVIVPEKGGWDSADVISKIKDFEHQGACIN